MSSHHKRGDDPDKYCWTSSHQLKALYYRVTVAGKTNWKRSGKYLCEQCGRILPSKHYWD